jgi:hypothetical protein
MKKILLITLMLIVFSANAQLSYTIVGTGVTSCYGNTSVITCPTNSTDPFFGQDQGLTPAYQDNGDGTVTDLNTGLMWVQARGSKMTWDSAFIMAGQCSVGGYNDWRFPTIKELYSLINFKGKSGASATACIAYLDTTVFEMAYGNLALGERIIDAQDWSTAQYTSLTMMADTTIFGVNFIDGRIKGYPKYVPPTAVTKQKMHVRFVRGNPLYGINSFVDNGDLTITDNATGLMWMKDDSQTGMNWEAALAYAQTKNTANFLGHNDWRLPTAKELHSIVDYTRCKDYTNSAAIDPIFNSTQITDEGGNINWPFFWSNTTHLDNNGGVYIAFGEALGYMKMPPTSTYYTLVDVHGAGAQRSDPKSGVYTSYYLGTNQSGNPVYGLGPQGDAIRIDNYVRLVRTQTEPGGIDEGNNNFNFMISPNPANSSITINTNLNGVVKIQFINCTGSVVKEVSAYSSTSVQLDISDLSKGLYIVQVNTNEKVISKKLIVN